MTTFPGTARFAVALAAALGLFVLATGTARAGIASVDGSVFSFEADRGEINDVVADPRFDGVLFSDASAPIRAGAGCTSDPEGVLCAYSGGPFDGIPKSLEMQLRDGEDRGLVDDRLGILA